MLRARVPLNLFGISFGLAGPSASWHVTATLSLPPRWVYTVLVVVAALVWLTSRLLHLRHTLTSRELVAGIAARTLLALGGGTPPRVGHDATGVARTTITAIALPWTASPAHGVVSAT